MKAIICDICRKPTPPPNHYTSGDIAGITINCVLPNLMGCRIIETQKKILDICPDCSEELKQVLRENNLIF